jgi:hypothetical protein
MAVVAGFMVIVAVVAQAVVLERLRAAQRRRAPWWIGYARDAGTLAAALMLWGACVEAGLAPAPALMMAMLSALFVYLADWALAVVVDVRPRAWLAALGIAWAVVLAALPHTIERGAERLLATGMASAKN